MKRCPQCGQTKPLEDFYPNRKAKDGRNCWCIACNRPPEDRELGQYYTDPFSYLKDIPPRTLQESFIRCENRRRAMIELTRRLHRNAHA